jgi:hypothetical protein
MHNEFAMFVFERMLFSDFVLRTLIEQLVIYDLYLIPSMHFEPQNCSETICGYL